MRTALHAIVAFCVESILICWYTEAFVKDHSWEINIKTVKKPIPEAAVEGGAIRIGTIDWLHGTIEQG